MGREDAVGTVAMHAGRERFHRSTRDELGEVELKNLGKAREIIGRWVAFYNERRLHASLKYLPPREYWAGEPKRRLEERKEKLERARMRREEIPRLVVRPGGASSYEG